MVVLLEWVVVAFACPGKATSAAATSAAGTEAAGTEADGAAAAASATEKCPPAAPGAPTPDPAHCATRAELVGVEACAWTTEMMAQRVLEEGRPWTFVGRLMPTPNALPSKVAAPFAVGPDGAVHVVANQVVESLTVSGTADERLELTGRILEVNGTRYFVATHVATRQL